MSEAEALREALSLLVGIAFAGVVFAGACAAVGVGVYLAGALVAAWRAAR